MLTNLKHRYRSKSRSSDFGGCDPSPKKQKHYFLHKTYLFRKKKQHMGENVIIVGYFCMSLSPLNRSTSQNISKKIRALNKMKYKLKVNR